MAAAGAAASAKASKELHAGDAFHVSVAQPFVDRAVYIGDSLASEAHGVVMQLIAVHLRAGYHCTVVSVGTDEKRTTEKLKRLGVGPYLSGGLSFLQCVDLTSQQVEDSLVELMKGSTKDFGLFFVDFGELALIHDAAIGWWREAAQAALDTDNPNIKVVVALAHEDAQEVENDPEMAFAAEIQSCSSDSLILRPLKSGYSKEISGHAVAERATGFSVNGSSILYKIAESGLVQLT